jgi:hypothetical protein
VNLPIAIVWNRDLVDAVDGPLHNVSLPTGMEAHEENVSQRMHPPRECVCAVCE